MMHLAAADVDAIHTKVFAPWIKQMGLSAQSVDETGADFLLPANGDFVHAGGVICGQALAAAADTAAVLTLAALGGGFRPVTTVDLTMHFIRPVPPGAVTIRIEVQSNGKRMAFIRADIRAEGSEKIAASATTAFMYLGD